MNRKKIVVANWKMNKNLFEGREWVTMLISKTQSVKPIFELIVAPPFTCLESLMNLSEKQPIKIAAQNCAYEKSGPFTGEISASMLSAIGVEYVILGHSERRVFFGENDDVISKKIRQALGNHLKVINCVGETKTQRNSNEQFNVVKSQIESTLKSLDKNLMKQIVIAYEPVWAIGTGVNATSSQAQEMHGFIRSELKQMFGEETASETQIIYGGSCNSKNAKEIFSQNDIDGGLIGSASLNVDEFIEITKAIN